MLRLAAAVEAASEHPLARAIVDGAKARDFALPDVADFDSDPGLGVSGRAGGSACRSAISGSCSSSESTSAHSQRVRTKSARGARRRSMRPSTAAWRASGRGGPDQADDAGRHRRAQGGGRADHHADRR